MTPAVDWEMVADLALELVSHAYGRGEDSGGPDDPLITPEARAIRAIRKGDLRAMKRSLDKFKEEGEAYLAGLERTYGPKP